MQSTGICGASRLLDSSDAESMLLCVVRFWWVMSKALRQFAPVTLVQPSFSLHSASS